MSCHLISNLTTVGRFICASIGSGVVVGTGCSLTYLWETCPKNQKEKIADVIFYGDSSSSDVIQYMRNSYAVSLTGCVLTLIAAGGTSYAYLKEVAKAPTCCNIIRRSLINQPFIVLLTAESLYFAANTRRIWKNQKEMKMLQDSYYK